MLYAPPPALAASYLTILESEGSEVFLARDPAASRTLLDSAPIRLIMAVAPVIGKDLMDAWKEIAPNTEIRVISGLSQMLEQHLVPASDLLDFTINALTAASNFVSAERDLPRERAGKLLALCEAAADHLEYGMRDRATVRINAAFLGLGRALTAADTDDETLHSRPAGLAEGIDMGLTELADGLGCPFPIGQPPPSSAFRTRRPTPSEVVATAFELISLQESGASKPALALRRMAVADNQSENAPEGLALHPMAVEAILSALDTGRGQDRGSIFIIDGDAALRNLLALRLGNEGYRVSAIANGRSALEEIRRNPPALILCETILPKLDGFALLDALKQGGLGEIPFIFLSSRDDSASINKGLLLGAADYLSKPVNPEVLLTKLQRVLGQSVAPAEASERVSLADLEGTTSSFPLFTYDELAIGILIHDRFRIEADLGEGGMGKIFKARDEKLEEWVVLKVMKTSLSSDKKALKHFKREIRLARRITHPGVVRIFDFWESGSLKFVTMEYLEGEDLRKMISTRGIFPLAVALRVATEIFEALSIAHGVGIVHRDVKPHNILMLPNGKIKVLDFGIAQGLDADQADGATITNAIVGTPEYMSPEQLSGSRVDARTDLYSGGLVLYELLTATLPFEGANRMVMAAKRLHTPPIRPTEHNPDIPIEVEAIVLNLLQRDREKRYSTARAVVEELRAIRI